jgi:predicted HicB family RNase H-like nuclease
LEAWAVARRNLTVQLDEETIRQAKILAAERGTSVSGLVARELEQLVARSARYEEAMHRAIALMAESVPRGGRTWRRDDLYEE